MAYRNGRNPFEDEEEDNFEEISDNPEVARIKQETDLYQQRMIDSSYRSLQMINESQGLALDTAEELTRQREQLERTNKNLDKMHGDLNETDRNLTSLKGIWGTMSNWFKKPIKNESSGSSSNDVKNVNDQIRKDNNEIQRNIKKLDHKTDLSWDNSADVRCPGATNEIVDRNLDQMLAGLTVLKGQGLALGNEIDDHNELLDVIQVKADKADMRTEIQTKKIQKILR